MIKLMKGDCIEMMQKLKSESIDCCITSPPYYGLRDYGEGQIGNESTPGDYVVKLIEVFQEVKGILKREGTLWLNLGDAYARRDGAAGGGNRELFRMEGISRRMCRWRKAGLTNGGYSIIDERESIPVSIAKEFWDIICEIIYVGYVDLGRWKV